MAYTSSDLAAVTAAIMELASGERATSVSFSNGQTVQYAPASIDDLKKLRLEISAEVNRISSTKRTFFRPVTGKGL